MAKMGLKILLIASISISVFFFSSDNSRSCGWSPGPDDYYKIFDEEIFNAPLLKPFFLSEEHFHLYDSNSELNERFANIKEWKEYFKNILATEDIDSLIYSSSLNDIVELKKYLANNKGFLRKEIKSNKFVGHLKQQPNLDFVNYLLFAKECEPHVKIFDVTWEEPIQDSTKMHLLIKEGLELYKKTNDDFLKLRYAFQIVRLAHYLNYYSLGLSLYDQLTSNLNVKSILNYWLLSHKAGMLKLTGKQAEGNYLFAKIFDECPSRRLIASNNYDGYYSEYQEVLSFTKTDKEREVIMFLSSYNMSDFEPYHLHRLNPKSEYLEIILFRRIQSLERSLLPDKYYYYQSLEKAEEEPRYYSSYYYNFHSMLKWINVVAGYENTLRPHVWYLASGYVSILLGNSDIAKLSFSKAEKLWPKNDSKYLDRLKICEILNGIDLAESIDKRFENEILPDLVWLKKYSGLNSKDALVYVFYKLYKRYKSEGNVLYANLCLGNFKSGYNVRRNPFKYPVDDIYSLIMSSQRTDFENFLIENFCYNTNDLLEIQGTRYLAEFNFEEAIKKFLSMTVPTDTLHSDPFIIHINDFPNYDRYKPKEVVYTKLTFAKKMVELSDLAVKDKSNSDKYYYLLANGYYNITHFGNSLLAADYYGDSYSVPASDNFNQKRYSEFELLDCSLARQYYEKAMVITKNRELASECCFMAAKCEQNEYFISPYSNNERVPMEYRTNFYKLLQNYSDTQFYQEALKECKYFNNFVTNYVR